MTQEEQGLQTLNRICNLFAPGTRIMNKEEKKMDIDEAIKHCKEQAQVCSIKECAEDHLQLAEWLEELKFLRTQFTLTAEEVEVVRYHFGREQKALDGLLRNMEFDDERDIHEYIRWKCQFKEISYILGRIKQWQQ